MIQFVTGNIEQATELMLFISAEILLKLEQYLKNIFQIRSNTLFKYKYKYKYKYANLVFFKYKYKYKYLRIWIQIQIRIRIWTQPWTGLYTCDEEFKWIYKNTQDCQKLNLYQIQINSNINQCFLKQFWCWSWRNGLDYSHIPFFVVYGKSHQGITQSCTSPSQPPQPCCSSGWAGGSAGWDYVTVFAELSSCC